MYACALVSSVLALSGCTTTQKDTAVGAGLGGLLGGVVGNNLGSGSGDREKGALIGAAAGALLGNQVGKQKEKNQQLENRVNSIEIESQFQNIYIENSNGSKSVVKLRKMDGGQYMGPRNEVYDSMPSQEQLIKVYGF